MAENKTKPTDASVEHYLSAIEDKERRDDCRAIATLMSTITGAEPTMWAAGIVGFDSYHYKYASGREGDAPVTGFAARKGDISVYLSADGVDQQQLLAVLGRHKMGKACLYIRKLSDIDMAILERFIRRSVEEIKRLFA